MPRYFSLPLTLCAALLCAAAPNAGAQTAGTTGTQSEAMFPLPEGVEKLVASDAHSSLLAVTSPDPLSELRVYDIKVKHLYQGGIARLFGGTVIPAAQLVTPALNGANANFGSTPIGFAGLGPNGFGQNGFGQNGFGQNGFGQNGFGNMPAGMPQNNFTPRPFAPTGVGQIGR